MADKELDDYWDYLVNGICAVSEETLQVVTSINGYSKETLDNVLYATTGYRSLEQYKEATE